MSRINHILISHLHGDHFLGLFGLIASFNLLGRKNPLYIIGPHQLKEIYFALDEYLNYELNFPLHFQFLNYKKQETIFEDEKIIVRSFPVKHRIPTCGFIFKEKRTEKNLKKDIVKKYNLSIKDIHKVKAGENYITDEGEEIPNNILTLPDKPLRSYAFTADTMYREKTAEYVNEVSLLYHEATFAKNKKKQAKETYHSTTFDAGLTAKNANVKHLAIGHFSSRYKTLDILLNETKQVFSDVSLAVDGKQYSIGYNKDNQIIIAQNQIEEK